MKKLLKIVIKKLRSTPLPIVRERDLIIVPMPCCRDLMPHKKTHQPQQKKLRKGYKKPLINRTRHKWILKKTKELESSSFFWKYQ